MKQLLRLWIVIQVLWLTQSIAAAEFDGWFHGGTGYNTSYNLAKQRNEPIIIYFHTDWCGWCKKLNAQYLETGHVKSFLNDLIKVDINPDLGTHEKSISKQYNVTGYPTFLVTLPSRRGSVVRLSPFLKSGQLSPVGFVEQIKEKTVHLYNQYAFQLYQEQDYDFALFIISKALQMIPHHSYSYYLRGQINYVIGYQDKNMAFLKNAENDLEKAIQLDPTNNKAKQALQQLRNLLRHMR